MPEINLEGVSQTLLIPLYLRAKESQREDALIKDDTAVTIVGSIDHDFPRIKLQGHDVLGLILRVREFDRFVRVFLASHPDGVVIHLGCGLDTRFERVDNGMVEWYDLDLSEVIQLRRKIIHEESGRYHLLGQSAFDPGWIDTVKKHLPRPFLFIAEGFFPYFESTQIKKLVRSMCQEFRGAQLVFDASKPWVLPSDNMQLFFSGMKARLHFGLRNGREVESWCKGIRLLEEWFYFGSGEDRVRRYRWMYEIPFLRKAAGIFHYQLSGK